MEIRVGTRPSRLAVKQAEEVAQMLPSIRFEVIRIETKGDRDKSTPLGKVEGEGFFTAEIEEALINGGIDAAIHSAKDLEESRAAKGLIIAAITRSLSPHECLVSRGGGGLKDLPPGAVVGTSSKKRGMAVLKYRPDLAVKDIRGDIEDRLAQLDSGKFDAIIVAHAALIRLGYEDRIAQIIPEDIVAPHPYQGRLAVQVRKDRKDLVQVFGAIDVGEV